MNGNAKSSAEVTPDPIRPPPLPLRTRPPTPWKKIVLIVGLSLLGALAFLVLVGALIFGGCMYLVQKMSH
ncbi:MAG TPA: hypothetical protein VGF13_11165 [Verrucomicrobiae bacterium]|jgi:hypothetical protein